MIKRIVTSLISIAAFIAVSAQYDVRKFGAVGNGLVLDTRSIQRAIDSAGDNGGGVIYFPAGIYKIGTLILKSNIALQLLPGSVIIGSENVNDYTSIDQTYESRTRDLYAKYFMFFAENETNISITGAGKIDGNGLKHFQEERPQNARPYMMRFVNCTQVVLKQVQLVESANWTLHLLACSSVNIDGISIVATAEGNRDGIDIDACKNVTIANCYISTTDDAIVMKATSDDVCRDIAISNCVLTSKGSAIKTGTESNGGFRNITVSNCVVKDIPIHAGIELMTVDGGEMQNILIQNISMENVATPFFIRIGARARPYKSGHYVQQIRNAADISLNNINVLNAKLPSSIIGLHNKKLSNISVTGYTARYDESQSGNAYNKVPSLEFDYPAANMFSGLPAYGIYCRDVSGLLLRDIKLFASGSEEKRPALVFDRVDRLELQSAEVTQHNINSPVAYMRNVENGIIAFCRSVSNCKFLFEVEGDSKDKICFVNNIVQKDQLLNTFVKALPEIENIDRYDTKNISIKNGPATIAVTMKKGGSQLCLLVRNQKSDSSKIKISYGNIVQEFVVDWKEWGWAPVSLLKQFSENEKVNITIEQADKGSSLSVSRYFIRSVNNGYTD
jgi:hypothetical protein